MIFLCVITEAIPKEVYYVQLAPNVKECSSVAFKVTEEGQIFTEVGTAGLTWETVPSHHCMWLMFMKQQPPAGETQIFMTWRQKINITRCSRMFNCAVCPPNQHLRVYLSFQGEGNFNSLPFCLWLPLKLAIKPFRITEYVYRAWLSQKWTLAPA